MTDIFFFSVTVHVSKNEGGKKSHMWNHNKLAEKIRVTRV